MTDAEPDASRWVLLGGFPQNLTSVPPTRCPDRLHTELASVFEGLRDAALAVGRPFPLRRPERRNGAQNLRLASTGMAARVCSTASRSRSASSRPGSAPSDLSTSPRGEITAL